MTSRINFLQREGLVISHEYAIQNYSQFSRIFRVRNLNNEIWMIKEDTFIPKGENPCHYIENGVVDELSLQKPLDAYQDLKRYGANIKNIGWKN